jgi:hypothetical protein
MSQAHENGHYRDLIPPATWKDLEETHALLMETTRKLVATLEGKLALAQDPPTKAALQKLLRQVKKGLR